MRTETEKRLLQAAIAILCLVPLAAGGAGMVEGPLFLRGVDAFTMPDLDSHFRYLSGLLFGIGLGFLSCVPRIESKGARMQLLAAIVVIGGLGRALSLASIGWPGIEHRFALGMELLVTPLLVFWQRRIARRSHGSQQFR